MCTSIHRSLILGGVVEVLLPSVTRRCMHYVMFYRIEYQTYKYILSHHRKAYIYIYIYGTCMYSCRINKKYEICNGHKKKKINDNSFSSIYKWFTIIIERLLCNGRNTIRLVCKTCASSIAVSIRNSGRALSANVVIFGPIISRVSACMFF